MAHDLSIQEDVLLAPYTTLGVGGPARFFIRARTEDQVREGLEFAGKHACPVFILGGGSNLVVSDSGFPGLVLKIELSGIGLAEDNSEEKVSAAAGEDWDRFVQYCVDRNLAGIECLSGIPGTVGGTPIQNVGAYGEDVSETIARIRILDRTNHSIADLSNSDCRFAYRASIFNTTHKGCYIILRVDFVLRPSGRPCLRYRDLERWFSGNASMPSIGHVREAVLQIRKTKGMLLHGDGSDLKSAGSFFKNPVVDSDQVSSLDEKAHACGILASTEYIPFFTDPSGRAKLSAAWLVERAGFHKGFIHRNVGISDKHSLALINRGNATANEVIDLMHMIQDRVLTLFEIKLQPEPVFIGFE
jgi:UDP-N-acetylmuramate dehydrogenase